MVKSGVCKRCGAAFEWEQDGPGRNRLYCPECRPHESSIKVCEFCGAEFEPKSFNLGQRFCNKTCAARAKTIASPRNIEHTCKHCGKAFYPKQADRTTYCSRECAFAYWTAHAQPKVDLTQVPHRCPVCSKDFQGWSYQKYCSEECSKAEARRRFAENWVSVRETNPYVDLRCSWCGNTVSINYHASRRRYCSERCGDRAGKAVRRARKHNAFVAPVYFADIWDRDKGICQLCGKKVDATKNAPHPKSPSLDHIIPLAKGGTHEPSNVQLAHFLCNCYKSDRDAGQLKLLV